MPSAILKLSKERKAIEAITDLSDEQFGRVLRAYANATGAAYAWPAKFKRAHNKALDAYLESLNDRNGKN